MFHVKQTGKITIQTILVQCINAFDHVCAHVGTEINKIRPFFVPQNQNCRKFTPYWLTWNDKKCVLHIVNRCCWLTEQDYLQKSSS